MQENPFEKEIKMKNLEANPKISIISTDLELAIAAHNDNQEAANILWDRYRLNMIGVLGKYNNRLYQLSQDEMESEAAEVFMHKLKEVFKPEKVKKSSDVFGAPVQVLTI